MTQQAGHRQDDGPDQRHHPLVPYSNVRIGAASSCLDMIILRKCVNRQCTFSHAACGIIPDVRAHKVVRNLQPGIDAFVNS